MLSLLFAENNLHNQSRYWENHSNLHNPKGYGVARDLSKEVVSFHLPVSLSLCNISHIIPSLDDIKYLFFYNNSTKLNMLSSVISKLFKINQKRLSWSLSKYLKRSFIFFVKIPRMLVLSYSGLSSFSIKSGYFETLKSGGTVGVTPVLA